MVSLLRQKKKQIKFIILVLCPVIIGYLGFFRDISYFFKKSLIISDVIGKKEWRLDAEQAVNDNYIFFLSQLLHFFDDKSIYNYLHFTDKINELVKEQGEDSPIYKYFSGEVVGPHDLFLAMIKLMDIRFYSKKIGEKEFLYFKSNDFDHGSVEYNSKSNSYQSFFWHGGGGGFEVEVIDIKKEYVLLRTPDYKIMEGFNFRTDSMEYSNNNTSCLIKLVPNQNKNSMVVEIINGVYIVERNEVYADGNTEAPTFKNNKKIKKYSIKVVFATDS